LASDLHGGVEGRVLSLRVRKQELSFEPKEFGDVITLAPSISPAQRLLDGSEGFGEAAKSGETLGESAQEFRVTVVPSASVAGIEFGAQQGRSGCENRRARSEACLRVIALRVSRIAR
jgi:hypothetical protein